MTSWQAAFPWAACLLPLSWKASIGLDRLAMIMCKADSLRDVTAFPKVQNASELMSECPSIVDKPNLDVLGIGLLDNE